MKIEWSPLAIERVLELAEYIALDKPDVAIEWAGDIFDSTEKLVDHPRLGRIVPELKDEDYRELIVGNYRVIYYIRVSEISVLTVLHGRKMLPLDEIKSKKA